MQDIVTVISTVGFPIFSFLCCGFALKYVYDKERKSLDDTIDKLGAITMAVEKNSESIRELTAEIRERSE